MLSGLIKTLVNRQKFANEEETKDCKTLTEKTVDIITNGLLFMFCLLYIIHIDTYVPSTYSFKNVLNIVESTFLVLSFISLIVNVLEFIN